MSSSCIALGLIFIGFGLGPFADLVWSRNPSIASRLVLAEDALELCVPEARQAVRRAVERMAPVLGLGGVQSSGLIDGDPGGGAAPGGVERIEDCVPIVRTIQAWEFWKEHGAWVEAERPEFGNPGVAARVRASSGCVRCVCSLGARRRMD